jgi:hypothetical protein
VLGAGDGQWGVGSMQHDLSDAVAWAVQAGIADPNRVCILGSSYGGYATFAGEPTTVVLQCSRLELWACCIGMHAALSGGLSHIVVGYEHGVLFRDVT